jgi:hypothetical protein
MAYSLGVTKKLTMLAKQDNRAKSGVNSYFLILVLERKLPKNKKSPSN